MVSGPTCTARGVRWPTTSSGALAQLRGQLAQPGAAAWRSDRRLRRGTAMESERLVPNRRRTWPIRATIRLHTSHPTANTWPLHRLGRRLPQLLNPDVHVVPMRQLLGERLGLRATVCV
jgi:hypothetical protein